MFAFDRVKVRRDISRRNFKFCFVNVLSIPLLISIKQTISSCVCIVKAQKICAYTLSYTALYFIHRRARKQNNKCQYLVENRCYRWTYLRLVYENVSDVTGEQAPRTGLPSSTPWYRVKSRWTCWNGAYLLRMFGYVSDHRDLQGGWSDNKFFRNRC